MANNSLPQLTPVDSCAMMLMDLHEEIRVAMRCIASNRISDFEMSLWRQEMLCSGLRQTIPSIARCVVDKATRDHLRELGLAIKGHSEAYEALIRESSRTTEILWGLCGLYRHAAGRSSNPNLPSLSYEA